MSPCETWEDALAHPWGVVGSLRGNVLELDVRVFVDSKFFRHRDGRRGVGNRCGSGQF